MRLILTFIQKTACEINVWSIVKKLNKKFQNLTPLERDVSVSLYVNKGWSYKQLCNHIQKYRDANDMITSMN